MTRRQRALEVIRLDVAVNGKATVIGIRAYVENRVSAKSRDLAMRQGMYQWERDQAHSETCCERDPC
jgi:hypothetical protein